MVQFQAPTPGWICSMDLRQTVNLLRHALARFDSLTTHIFQDPIMVVDPALNREMEVRFLLLEQVAWQKRMPLDSSNTSKELLDGLPRKHTRYLWGRGVTVALSIVARPVQVQVLTIPPWTYSLVAKLRLVEPMSWVQFPVCPQECILSVSVVVQ